MEYYGYSFIRESDLTHYGVLGMKWGVRKNPQKAYTKSSAKLRKYNKKFSVSREKAQKAYRKAEKNLYGFWASKEDAQRYAAKGNKYMNRSRGYLISGANWYKKMKEVFSKHSSIEFDKDIVNLGEKMVKEANELHDSLYTTMLTNSIVDPKVYQMK